MGRRPCCSKEGLNRGAWTVMEDKILTDYIKVHGEGKWRNLPSRAGLKRCGKSCRLRWMNYLRPDIKRGNITLEEEDLIIRLHNLLGNRWSLIAGRLPGRTDNEIKNYWNTTIAKRVQPHPSSNPNPNSSKKPRKNPSPVTCTEPGVIRAKASKCTKLFITPCHQPPTSQQFDTVNPLPEPSKIQDFHCGDGEGPEPLDGDTSQFISMENNYNQFDFTMDFEMDEKILSDFLNNGTDYATAPFDLDNNDQKEETGTNTSTSSPPLLLSNELSDSDIQSMELLLDAGMDWFQDQ